MATQLYEADFYAWTQRQAAVLRRMAAERSTSVCPFDLDEQVLDPQWLPEPLIRPAHEC